MSLSPQQVIDNADGLTGLAAILSDPKAYKSKLDELKAHAKEGNEAFDKANEALVLSKKNLEASEALKKEANEVKDFYTKEHTKLSSLISYQKKSLEDSLVGAKVSLEANRKRTEELNLLSNSLVQKESELTSKHADVSSMKKELDKRIGEALAQKDYYEGLIAKVKASVG